MTNQIGVMVASENIFKKFISTRTDVQIIPQLNIFQNESQNWSRYCGTKTNPDPSDNKVSSGWCYWHWIYWSYVLAAEFSG